MLRDRLLQLTLANGHYGYRRLGLPLCRERWEANHTYVLRLLRSYDLLFPRRPAFMPELPKTGVRPQFHPPFPASAV